MCVCVLPFIIEILIVGIIQKGIVPGIKINAERFSDGNHSLEPRFLTSGDAVQGRYVVTITGEELRGAGGNEPALLVSRISGEGYRAYLNGTLIGSAGDHAGGRANIWNTTLVFPVDSALVREQNEIVFDIHHEYNAGLTGIILLTDIDTARGALGIIINVSDALSYISIGLLFSGCIAILLMIMLNTHRHYPHILLLISMLALGVYALDFIFIPYLPFPYIIFKKIIVGAKFMSVGCLSAAISMIFHRKIPIVIGTILFAIIMAAIIWIRDIIIFTRLHAFCSVAIPVSATVWFATIIPCFKLKEETWIFALGLGLFALESAYNVVMLFLCPSMLLGSVFSFAFIYLSTMILLMNLDIRRKNEIIQHESSRRFHFYRKAITDGLTGLFNREYIISHLEKERPPFAVAMLDIDHFKEINDHFGHQSGDRVMQYVAGMITGALRGTDLVGRYGGDEFIAILRSSGANAFAVMEKFRNEIAQNPQGTEEASIPVTFSIGICYVVDDETPDQILRKADMALYLAKRKGRNQVCVYADE